MDLFTYLMAKKGHNTHRDLFSYLLGKNAGGSGTYTTFSGTSLNISNTLQAKIKNIALEGNTSQNGDPTPDTPIPIKVVTDNQNVEISGNTLTDTVDYTTTVSGLSITSKPNGIIKLDGTATANINSGITSIIGNTYQIPIGTNYVHYEYISGSVVSGGIVVNARGTGNTAANQKSITSSNYSTNSYVQRIISKDSTVDKVQFICSSDGSFDNLEFRVWWSRSNDTEYVPYQSQTYPLSLGNKELFRNYTDETRIYIDYIFKNEIGSSHYKSNLEEDSWYIYNRNKKVELKNYNYTNSITKRTNTILFLGTISGKARSRYYCNILSNYHFNTLINSDIEGIGDGGGYANRLYISVNKNRLEGYTDELTNSQLNTLLKQFLESNNAYAWYSLSTPTYEKIIDTTLIQQLENINNARSYKGTTIIECSSTSTDNETIGFSGDIKVSSVGLGNPLNTSLLSSNLQEQPNLDDIQEEPNLDDVNEIEDIEQNDEPIEEEVS